MTWLDHLFVAGFAVFFPVHGWFEYQKLKRELAAGRSEARLREYWSTARWLTGLGLAAIAIWGYQQRPFADLGLGLVTGNSLWIGTAAVATMLSFMLWQLHRVRALDEQPADATAQLEAVAAILPHTAPELRAFKVVSLAAGIFEEILFRGFLIAYLETFVGLIPAAALSVAVFTLGHLYQGFGNLPRIVVASVVFTLLYLGTGSLWLAMILHASVDALSGMTAFEVLNKPVPQAMASQGD